MEHIFEAAIAVFGGATVIQLLPIKIDPWTWLARKIGRAINGEVLEKVSNMEQRLSDIEDRNSEMDAKNARIRILRFGDECRHQVKHSREHFDQILEDIDNYETYCSEHPNFRNNKACLTISRIKEAYKQEVFYND